MIFFKNKNIIILQDMERVVQNQKSINIAAISNPKIMILISKRINTTKVLINNKTFQSLKQNQ